MASHSVDSRAGGSSLGQGCLTAGVVVALLLSLVAAGLFATWVMLGLMLGAYEGEIYPNVYVHEVNLGGLSPEEAAAELSIAFGHFGAGTIVLRDGERAWPVPWSELGMEMNVAATVDAALQAGRDVRGLWGRASLWLGRRRVAPVFVIDPAGAREGLGELAPQMSVPPVDATLRLEGTNLVAVPGQPGRELHIDGTLETLLSVAAGLSDQVAVTFRPVYPAINDAGAAQAQAERLLGSQLVLSAYDPLTEEEFTWTVGRDILATWLSIENADDGSGLVVAGDEESISSTLAQLATALGDGRGFRLEEATRQVKAAFEGGLPAVELYLTHPERTYVVQYGDTVTNIGERLGMPPGLIAEVNQGVDLDNLRPGQTLVIPSQDVLTPHMPVRNKRIVISIAEQRMRVYEDGVLLHDWPVSTGIEGSPTYPGVFQVLGKEENAYGSQWDLWMPHFISIYRAGGDVYNGIHGLPTLSSGQLLWAGLLGSPASYGCIILNLGEAELLYNWVETGVVVVVE
jgi:lipoprotein-anchoring transpeptidase ErfK/SrfK